MAAEVIAAGGRRVAVIDQTPSPARKLLLAGRGGLNLTHSEPFEQFVTRYGDAAGRLTPAIRAFTPDDLRLWAAGLGIETFVGSSGRVFPVQMKASTLVRGWLRRLRELGVTLHQRHRWLGWDGDGRTVVETGVAGADPLILTPRAIVLALGGASWPRTGSDGRWPDLLRERGVTVSPLRPSNMGFEVPWSDHLRDRFAGEPIKGVSVSVGDRQVRGEFVITQSGVEGGAVYAVSARLRDQIEGEGWATLTVDLLPDLSLSEVVSRLQGRGARSLSTHLKKAFSLAGAKAALLREFTPQADLGDARSLARFIKTLPLVITGVRPVERAISSAGGVVWDELSDGLMLKNNPGLFVSGEMLDWEAPTGGYLLQGCFALGRQAGRGVLQHLSDAT